jgi:hypothetical protein
MENKLNGLKLLLAKLFYVIMEIGLFIYSFKTKPMYICSWLLLIEGKKSKINTYHDRKDNTIRIKIRIKF